MNRLVGPFDYVKKKQICFLDIFFKLKNRVNKIKNRMAKSEIHFLHRKQEIGTKVLVIFVYL